MEILKPHASMLTLPWFLLMFLVLYLFAYFIVFRTWGPKNRPEASSCLISFAHGTPALLLAFQSISFSLGSRRSFALKNTDSQNMVLEFSIAYFLADLFHYLLFYPNDFPFIFHHLATLFVFVTCRFVIGYGAYCILVILILAEATSVCQNVWTLAGARRVDIAAAARVHEVLKIPFYVYYSVVRGVLGPWFVYEMGVFYGSGLGGDAIPRWAWVSWLVVIIGAIGGSILWVFNLWMELFRERRVIQKKLS